MAFTVGPTEGPSREISRTTRLMATVFCVGQMDECTLEYLITTKDMVPVG